MNTKNNTRAKATKEAFKNALIELLLEDQRTEQITVTQICSRAGINRSTFYSHYDIPMDIMQEIEEEVLTDYRECIVAIAQSDKSRIICLLRFIKENARIFRILLKDTHKNAFYEKVIASTLSELEQVKSIVREQRYVPYIYDYLLNGSAVVLLDWINSGFNLSESELAELLQTMSKNVLDPFLYKKGERITVVR